MRNVFLLFIVASTFTVAVIAAEKPGEPTETVRFGDEQLELAWQIESASNNIKEFIPKGQSLRSWTTFVGIYEYPLIDDVRGFARQMAESIKQQNPRAQSWVTYDPKTDIAIVDFVTWPVDAKFVEYNVFRFERHATKGIVGYQYAVRDYNDKKNFFRNLDTLRKRSHKTMSEEGVVIQPGATEDKTASKSPAAAQR